MNSIIDTTRDLVESFTSAPTYVILVEDNISKLAEEIPQSTLTPFGKPNIPYHHRLPIGSSAFDEDKAGIVFYELVANSVNYCYWYGKHNIRINNSSASQMYKLLDEVFNRLGDWSYSSVIRAFKEELIKNRFPLIDERIKHLNEIEKNPYQVHDLVDYIARAVENENYDIDELLAQLITGLPGYAQDMFLKRAFLFFIELYRRMGWFKNQIHRLPIPSDYQIPKILHYYGCVYYCKQLQDLINNSELIPEGSLMECEIRASAIKACDVIAEKAKCKPCDVDTFLFNNRNICGKERPFHLTITSNY